MRKSRRYRPRGLWKTFLRPALAAAFALFAISFVLAVPAVRSSLLRISGISATGSSNSKQYCGKPSQQCKYQNMILQDRSALSPGVIVVQQAISIPLGQPYLIRAAACGKSAVCSEYVIAGTVLPEPEPSRLQGKLLIGARIQATLQGSFPGTVHSVTPTVQPIIASTDAATWIWRIQPSRGGDFNLFLTLTPLAGDTSTTLTPDISVQIRITVTTTLWQNITSVLASVRDFLLGLSGLFSALGVTAAAAVIWVFRRTSRIRERYSLKKSAAGAEGENTTKQPVNSATIPLRSPTDTDLQTSE